MTKSEGSKMDLLTGKCKEAIKWLSKLQSVVVSTALTWATVWPLLYLVMPIILGEKVALDLLQSRYVPMAFYIGMILAFLQMGWSLKAPILAIVNGFISHAAYFGKFDRQSGGNDSIQTPPDEVIESLGDSLIKILKFWIIAALALLTLNLGIDERMEKSRLKFQTDKIERLNKRVGSLEQIILQERAESIVK
jgi:hypothetical protein